MGFGNKEKLQNKRKSPFQFSKLNKLNSFYSKMSSNSEKKAVDLGLLEEDDEFEEFPADEWDSKQEDQTDVNVWEDNWDDDAIEDDFSVQLRSELENQGMKMES